MRVYLDDESAASGRTELGRGGRRGRGIFASTRSRGRAWKERAHNARRIVDWESEDSAGSL